MKTRLILIAFVFCASNALSQPFVFQKNFGTPGNDYGFSFIPVSDGGFVMAGHSNYFGPGDLDVVLLKLDSSYNLQWFKRYGGTGNEQAIKVINCSDGGFAISGMTQSFGAGGYDAMIIKTDSTGNVDFMKTFGGLTDDRFLNVRQTIDSGYILAGSTTSFGSGNWDMLYVKLNTHGDTLWTKIIGGTDYDQGTDAIETYDSGFIFTGRAASWGAGYADVFVCKTTAGGDTLWTKTAGSFGFDEGMKIKPTMDNGFIITGASNGVSNGGYQAFTNKFDSTGNLSWSKVYGGTYTEATYDILQLEDSGYAIVGITESFGSNHLRPTILQVKENYSGSEKKLMGDENTNVFLIRINAEGDTLWSYAYGGTSQEEGFAIAMADNGGFLLSGYTMSFNSDSIDYYVIKTDSNGFSGCNEERAYPNVDSPPTSVSATTAQVISGLSVSDIAPFQFTLPTFNQFIQCFVLLTSQPELSFYDSEIRMLPNPCASYFTIRLPENCSGKFYGKILDITGRKVKQFSIDNINETKIDVTGLAQGLYQVSIISEPGSLCYNKLLVKGL